ncbi:MAG: YMGG-like glycine zipper-containing protein [Ginsengibacter sp.]
MKLLTTGIIIALALSACNGDSKTDSETRKEIVADTSTNYNNSVLTDTATSSQPVITPAPVAPEKVTTSEVKTKTTTRKEKPATTSTIPTPAPVTTESSTVNTTTQPAVNTDPVPAEPEEKKGMSKAAKGAIIGGGAGAIGGAIISKKKGKGAIIGGVLGAAGGYIIGRKKDKNDTTR